MPELPEVETVRRGLEPHLCGRRIELVTLNRPDLRIPFPDGFVETLQGATIERIDRRAKYLLIYLSNGKVVLSHLGMSGKLLLIKRSEYKKQPHDHVRWDLVDGHVLIYHDPRRFGLMTLTDKDQLFSHKSLKDLGPEPLGNQFHATYLAEALQKRKAPVKQVLMDQKVVVGVGNIYACEALFHSGTNPFLPACEAVERSELLVTFIRKILRAAIESGGSTLKDYRGANGEAGYFQHHFLVYGREGELCERCKSPIKRQVQAGRSTFFCDICQCVD